MVAQLANRRAFDKYLLEQMAVNARQGRSLALLLVDVDHFKAYNDLYGHQAGDDCLRQVAAALRLLPPPSNLAARYGGEEFALILPDTEALGALHVAKAVRAEVLHREVPHAHNSTGPHVSASIGVAVVRPVQSTTVEPLLAAADAALYQAKSRGRNQVVCADAAADGRPEAMSADRAGRRCSSSLEAARLSRCKPGPRPRRRTDRPPPAAHRQRPTAARAGRAAGRRNRP